MSAPETTPLVSALVQQLHDPFDCREEEDDHFHSSQFIRKKSDAACGKSENRDTAVLV